jgi:cyanate permease
MLVNLTFGLVGLFLSVPASAASHSRLGFLGSVLLARGVCCICFFLGLWYENGSILILTITLLGIFGKTLLDSIAYVLVYLYAVEVQATESRASSSGMALAVGRLGGVLAPVVYEVIPHTPGSFVLVISVLAFVCAALALGLPIETKDRQLGEIAAETAPLPKEAK